MSHSNSTKSGVLSGGLQLAAAAAALALLATAAHAAAPGIQGTSFSLNAGVGYSSQPDGEAIYSWGYGCTPGSIGVTGGPVFAPAEFAAIGSCPPVQLPGPTLIVTEGALGAAATFQVTLTNSLPTPAGNTSIIFPGLSVTAAAAASQPTTCTATTPAPQGLLTTEASPGCSVTYTVSIPYGSAGTHIYQSGTQPDLQTEMGLFGAVIVLPNDRYTNCDSGSGTTSVISHRDDFRLAPNAYDHPLTCYDREYLFQWSEIDPRIHRQAEAQVAAAGSCKAGAPGCSLDVATEPYRPTYYLINGRSMPDDMDADYAPNYPIQPYNGNPHMHPGELILVRVTGQGHWQHPFHEHANHVRILARDAHLLLAQANNPTGQTLLAGRMEFNTDTTPGQAFDGIFYWSGKGLGWDIFGHTPLNPAGTDGNPVCVPDVNGYYTAASSPPAAIPTYTAGVMTGGAQNYYEWCQDHDVPLEANPVSTNPAGTVGAGGPVTLMDPLVLTNGLWYNGTPYLGPDAVNRSRGPTALPPGSASQNPLPESGIAFMWHSHNEREITTSDVFPGGMLMMMLVDPYVWNIDETL